MQEGKALYLKVKEAIETDIENNKKAGISSLLSENSYCERLGVSRMTVRKAVDELVNQCRIQRIPGKGLEVTGTSSGNRQLYKRLAFVIRYDPEDDFFSRMVVGCTQTANHYGYSYNIYNISNLHGKDIFSDILKTNIDGIIFTYYLQERNISNFKCMSERGIPVVIVDNLPFSGDYPFILSDDVKGGYLACTHLLSKGHRKIILLSYDIEEFTQVKRLEGYRKAISEANLPQENLRVLKIRSAHELFKELEKIYENSIEYTAIAGLSDTEVIDCYSILKELEINVPSQVALIGYGNQVGGRLLEIPLSTVEMPVFEMGVQACQMLVDFLEGRGTLDKRILDIRIIERDSTL